MSSAAVEGLFKAAETRRSVYTLTNQSTISDERIQEIVGLAIKHAPSPWNVQSARVAILLRKDHEKLWDIAGAMLKRVLPEATYDALAPRVAAFKASYGSVR
jgi:uncharacterized protein